MFLYNQILGVEVGWNVRDADDCDKSANSVKKYYQNGTNHFFYLHLALPGVVETLAVPSSKWTTSPATSLVVTPGLALSTTWISPIYNMISPKWKYMSHILSAEVTYPRWHTQQLGQCVLQGRAHQREARQKQRVSSETCRLEGSHWACGPSSVRGADVICLGTQSGKFRRAIVKIVYVSGLRTPWQNWYCTVWGMLNYRRWKFELEFDIPRDG